MITTVSSTILKVNIDKLKRELEDQGFIVLAIRPKTPSSDVEADLDGNITGPALALAQSILDNHVDNRVLAGQVSLEKDEMIKGNKTFEDNVVIEGDLTVNGTTTTLNTEELDVEDNIVRLNSNFTSGSPTLDTGIEALRGDDPKAQLLWNESTDTWQAGTDGDMEDLALDGDLSDHIANTSNPHSVTKSQVGLGNVTNDAQLTRGSNDFTSFTQKAVPIEADILLIEDSAASYVKKYISLGSIEHGRLQNIGTNTHAQIDSHIASTSNPHSVTKSQVGLGNVTDDAQLKRAAGDFVTFAAKSTLVAADTLLIEDSEAGDAKKKITFTDVITLVGGGIPAGVIIPYGGSSAPIGWLLADGSVVSQATYAALFAVFGSTFDTGGEGVGNFRLPDMRQRFPLGKAAAGTGSTLGGSGGSIDHTHTGGSHTHSVPAHHHAMGVGANLSTSHTGSSSAGTSHTHAHTLSTSTSGGHGHGFSLTAASAGLHRHGLNADVNGDSGATRGIIRQAGPTFVDTLGGVQIMEDAGAHTHSVTGSVGGADGTHSHTITGGAITGEAAHTHPINHTHSTFTGSIGLVTGGVDGNASMTSGSGGAVATSSNNPPFLALNYIVKV